jgi:hypothetical protein
MAGRTSVVVMGVWAMLGDDRRAQLSSRRPKKCGLALIVKFQQRVPIGCLNMTSPWLETRNFGTFSGLDS